MILSMHPLRNVRNNIIIMIINTIPFCMHALLALKLNSPSVINTTVNNSIQFRCEYACMSNAVAIWFIEEKVDMDVNLDQLFVRRSSNGYQACRSTSTADTFPVHYSEILEINPLVSFDHPLPVYCAYILVCNNHVECRPKICFSDLVGEFQGMLLL